MGQIELETEGGKINMQNAIVTEALNEICSNISSEYPEGPRGFFVYAEVNEGVIAPSLVQVYADHVLWLVPWDIGDALYRMWQSADSDAKWQALTLDIHEDKFEAQFIYDPGAQFDEQTDARSMARIKKRFPALPVRHPPYDQTAIERRMMQRSGRRAASFDLEPQKGPDSNEDS
jgi:hypothetical protein